MARPELVRLAWVSILAFLRISTDARMRGQSFLIEKAVSIVGEWFALLKSQSRGALVIGAHLAALAFEYSLSTAWLTATQVLQFAAPRAFRLPAPARAVYPAY